MDLPREMWLVGSGTPALSVKVCTWCFSLGLSLAEGRSGRGAVWQPNPQEHRAVSNALHQGLQRLIQGSIGHKVSENQRRKSGPQEDWSYRLQETIYIWRWKLGWGNGRDEEP